MTNTQPDHVETETSKRHSSHDISTTIGAGRPLAWLLVVCGLLGLLASWSMTVDDFRLYTNGNARPACTIFNPAFFCGDIINNVQEKVFGVPDAGIGLVAYPVLTAVGVGLLAGARYRRWHWLGLQAGTLLGVCFVTWLQYRSLHVIGAIYPWCLLAWATTIAAFWYVTVHNIKHRILPAPNLVRRAVTAVHWVVPVVWYGLIILLIFIRWWSYWRALP